MELDPAPSVEDRGRRRVPIFVIWAVMLLGFLADGLVQPCGSEAPEPRRNHAEPAPAHPAVSEATSGSSAGVDRGRSETIEVDAAPSAADVEREYARAFGPRRIEDGSRRTTTADPSPTVIERVLESVVE